MSVSAPRRPYHLATGSPGVAPGGRSSAATFLRFLAVGATGSLAYGLLFLALAAGTHASHVTVNLVATGASTVLSSELHRRYTFHATGRGAVGRSQSAGIGMAAVGLAVSSLVLAGWSLLNPDAGDLATLAVVYCCTGALGLANFVTQRRVLAQRIGHPAAPDLPAPSTPHPVLG